MRLEGRGGYVYDFRQIFLLARDWGGWLMESFSDLKFICEPRGGLVMAAEIAHLA
ncbi:hypothetical protein NOC27_2524 [Nitrosococcus oceani AFC27]|uniref:hypothetical protein n=1 Tax=Nitrosococcus oceani TaxID=1229 RepID=UPI000183C823|nr:hypothetical protein [Nitrosococcus oceani]EDZ65844.1 hypothetical protein NOC27_2524 [Nitrosococcus oceani AFC27]